jgi:hypothetical protein
MLKGKVDKPSGSSSVSSFLAAEESTSIISSSSSAATSSDLTTFLTLFVLAGVFLTSLAFFGVVVLPTPFLTGVAFAVPFFAGLLAGLFRVFLADPSASSPLPSGVSALAAAEAEGLVIESAAAVPPAALSLAHRFLAADRAFLGYFWPHFSAT